MRNFKKIITGAIFFGLLLSGSVFANADKVIEKQYSGKEKIKIKLILGSCLLQKSKDSSIHVKVVHSYDEDDFEAIFREKGKKLILKESLHGNGGHSKWTVAVPEGVEIDFEAATGDLIIEGTTGIEIDGNTGTGDIEINNVQGKFKLNTGTGSIDAEQCKGEMDLNSGTGRVKIKNSAGNFEANSGTGDVYAEDITIEDDAEFSSGTGDAEVKLPKGSDFDLTISSGTGDAFLDMDGLPIEGYFEFTAHARKGRIASPIEFDTVDEYENGNSDYIRKSFTIGKKTPRYFISTGTGKAKLIK